jgi:alanyl-tRNA synthetase
MCSGMQRVKHRFPLRDRGRLSSLQSCVRTNDLDLVGDGSHLSYFEMLGNFSFGNDDYSSSVEMWDEIVRRLSLPITSVHVHPQSPHRPLWERLGYVVLDDEECVWKAENIGGYCCEMYVGSLEVGNLVNTLDHSTDVGFGWERMLQVLEGKQRVDDTSLFRRDLDFVLRDHIRTLESFWRNGVEPGNKGRGYVCRRLLRRMLMRTNESSFCFKDWLESERQKREVIFSKVKKLFHKHGDKSDDWWWSTFGILPEERPIS